MSQTHRACSLDAKTDRKKKKPYHTTQKRDKPLFDNMAVNTTTNNG